MKTKKKLNEWGNPWDTTPEESKIANAEVEDIVGDQDTPNKCPNCGSTDLTPNKNNVTFCNNCGTPSWKSGNVISYQIKTRNPDEYVTDDDVRSTNDEDDPYQGVFRPGFRQKNLNETIYRIKKNMGLI